MRISNLELLNFRNHGKTFLIFGNMNYILGRNNAGKSTVKGGLQLALTGENEWCENGSNAELIKTGEKAAVVEAEIDGLGIIRRSVSQKGNGVQFNGADIPDRELEKEIVNEFGAGYNVMNCVLLSSKFLKMKANEQKDFLIKLSGITLDKAKVIAFMKSPSDEAKNEVEKSLPDNVSIESLDAIYKEFYATRAASKKVRDSLKAKLDAMGTVPTTSGVDINTVEAALPKLKERRDEIVRKLAVIEEREQSWEKLDKELKKLSSELEALEKKVDKNLDITAAEKEIEKLKIEETATEGDIRVETTKRDTLNGQNNSLKAIISRLNQKQCPLTDKLVCTADKKSLELQLQVQVDDNDKLIKEANEKINTLNESLEKARKKRNTLDEQIKLKKDYDTKVADKDRVYKDLSAIELPDTTELQLKLQNAQEEEDQMNDLKKTHEDWQRKKNEYDKTNQDYLNDVAKVNLYEYLCTEFSASGVKARILEKIIEPIQNRCNTMLGKLTNNVYSLKFVFEDKDFNIIVSNGTGTINVNKMSKSEIFRISIIIQEAISNLAGLKILYIDDAEILIADHKNMCLLMDLLNEISGEYDQIFVTATVADINNIPISNIPDGSKIFYVENGIVNPLANAA